jgi:hypothetical protein
MSLPQTAFLLSLKLPCPPSSILSCMTHIFSTGNVSLSSRLLFFLLKIKRNVVQKKRAYFVCFYCLYDVEMFTIYFLLHLVHITLYHFRQRKYSNCYFSKIWYYNEP